MATQTVKTSAKVPAKTSTGPDLEAGKAVAEANAEALSQEPTVEERRDRRAEIIEELQEKSAEQIAAVQAEADKAGLHEAKLDDAGAAEQQKSARDNNADLLTELADLTGPPVTAPVIESGGSIRIVSRRDDDADTKEGFTEVTKARFVGFNLHLIGEDFPKGEVIIDIRRAENAGDHQRFSTWTESGSIDGPLPGILGPGDYLVHCETVVTQVGEGRDDHQQLIKETAEVSLELY